MQLVMEQALQEGDKAAGSEPTLHLQHTQEGCWGNMEHFTYSIVFPSLALPSLPLHISFMGQGWWLFFCLVACISCSKSMKLHWITCPLKSVEQFPEALTIQSECDSTQ